MDAILVAVDQGRHKSRKLSVILVLNRSARCRLNGGPRRRVVNDDYRIELERDIHRQGLLEGGEGRPVVVSVEGGLYRPPTDNVHPRPARPKLAGLLNHAGIAGNDGGRGLEAEDRRHTHAANQWEIGLQTARRARIGRSLHEEDRQGQEEGEDQVGADRLH